MNANCTDQTVPDGVFNRLMGYGEFKILFRDRIYKHLFHDGMLTPAKAGGAYTRRADEISLAVVAETARWQPTSSVGALPWDRDGEWTVEKNYLLNTYFPQRPAKLLAQFRARGWYPVDAPEMSQRGGAVAPGTPIALTGPTGSEIYYTLDGSDPRLPGNAVSPAALAFTGSSPQPIFINGPVTLRARARTGSEWSAVNEAAFYLIGTPAASTANVTVSEIHYHPEGTGQDDAEFIEFRNTGGGAVNMEGVQLSGAVAFKFPSGVVLLPGEHVVVVNDLALFDARYRTASSPWYHAGIRVAGTWSGSLSNGGEAIVVLAADDTLIVTFSYDDDGAWPGRADGRGSSLELRNAAAAPTTLPEKAAYLGTPESWRPSSEFHGSPGYAGAGPDNRIVINEVLSASRARAVDFIELLNISGLNQNIGGWFLSDSSDTYRKYRLPATTQLAPGAYLVLTENDFNSTANPSALVPFSLSSAGDDVFLTEADSTGNLLRFADRVEFSAAPAGMSFGRFPNGTGPFELLRQGTSGVENSAALFGYAGWIAAMFSGGTPSADLTPGADPDDDGLPNLLEFALRRSPLTPDGTPLALQPAADGSPLQICFTARDDVPGLMVRLETSSDLSTWDTSESQVERLSATAHGDGTTTVTARLRPSPDAPHRYVRLAVP